MTKDDKKRLQELKEVVEFQVDNSPDYGRPANTFLLSHDMQWLLKKAEERVEIEEESSRMYFYLEFKKSLETIENMEKEVSECYRVIKSMKEEIEYALHSNKSKDVKKHYLENAVRYAKGVLEVE